MDATLKSLGGCGRFQVLIGILVFTSELISPFSVMFMTFGMYNPGWKCMDNFTSASITNVITNSTSEEAKKSNLTFQYFENCPAFEACHQVQFNPESVTIVTEWQLICSKAWVPKFITSLQMVGIMIGAYLGGYLGDIIGRQRVICLNMAMNGLCNLIAGFSVSWYMFLILRIFIGITYASMISFPFVYTSEMTPMKWRSFLASVPAWNIGASLFAVTAMLTRNWRHIHLITAALTLLFLLPILWVPESLRWLTVKGKMQRASKAACKIASINKRPAPEQDVLVQLAGKYKASDVKGRKYSWCDLWRKDVRFYTFIFGFMWISMAITYYTTSFGAKNFVGDIYINLIILFLTEIPVSAFSTVGPNILGRKWATFTFMSFATVSLFVIVFVDRLASGEGRGTIIFAMVILARFTINGAWYVLYTLTAEIYPTVIRGTSMGYGSCVSRIGGILAPYLVPNSSDKNFISFLIMACLIVICNILLLFLPETKGKALAETWSEEDLPSSSSLSSEDNEKRNFTDDAEKI